MFKMGFTPSPADQCLYIKGNVTITVWVDDMIACGPDEQELDDVAIMIGKVFKTTDLEVPSRFLGMEIVRDWHKREIYLS
jgi:hypothetical protein